MNAGTKRVAGRSGVDISLAVYGNGVLRHTLRLTLPRCDCALNWTPEEAAPDGTDRVQARGRSTATADAGVSLRQVG